MASSISVVGTDNRTKLQIVIEISDRSSDTRFTTKVDLPPKRLDLTFLEAKIQELCPPNEVNRLTELLHSQLLDQILK